MGLSFRTLSGVLSLLVGLGVMRVAAGPLEPSAADPLPTLSSDEIVTKMVENYLARARALGAYQGTRVYRLEYRGFPSSRSAEMTVDVKYRSPGTKDFRIRSENGSKLILDKIFKRMMQTEKEALTAENQSRVALNQDNYRFALAGNEIMPTGPS